MGIFGVTSFKDLSNNMEFDLIVAYLIWSKLLNYLKKMVWSWNNHI